MGEPREITSQEMGVQIDQRAVLLGEFGENCVHASMFRPRDRRIDAMRAFSAFFVAAGMLTTDLCANLRPPLVTRTLRSTVTPEQISALRAFMQQDTMAEGWRDRAMLEVLLATALRAGHLVALDVGDSALEAATVTVRGRKTRTLALTPAAVMTLATYLHVARPSLYGRIRASRRCF
jgi:site-specific recombinase XerD